MNAVAGRRPETYGLEPFRFDQMRPGCYDVDARVRDMDINGVWASVNFPSMITGLLRPGLLRRQGPRPRPGLHPGLERLALRGVVHAVPRAHRPARDHLPGRPRARRGRDPAQRRTGASRRSRSPSGRTRSGCPRCGTGRTGTRSWRRSIETDTVVSLHVGSSGLTPAPPGAGIDSLHLGATLFGQLSLTACAEWLWSGYALRHPDAQDRHERGRHRLGGHARRPARQHRRPLRLRPGLGRCARPRCCSATSGSAPSTTPRPSTPATPSGSTTSWWRSTTRTATAPGPTPRPSSRSAGATSRPTSCAPCAARTRRRSTAIRCPDLVLPR